MKKKKLLSIALIGLLTVLTTTVSAQSVNNMNPYSVSNQKKTNAVTENNIVMLDVSRRKMNEQQIVHCIKSIDPSKFQFIQLHLSDNENYAIKSNILHNTNEDNTLSISTLKSIVRYANKKGFTVIPDIDVPAHAKSMINDLKKCDSPWLERDIIMNDETLDYTNSDALNFVKQLYVEVLPAFQDQKFEYFMIGGDEVPRNKNCAIQFSDFINKLNQYLNQKGFNTIVWNDSLNQDALNNLDQNITIDYWIKSDANITAQQFNDHGNPVKNVNEKNSYYNTIDLDNYKLRKEKSSRLVNQVGSKMLCLWGSDDRREKYITNKKIISYIKQVEKQLK